MLIQFAPLCGLSKFLPFLATLDDLFGDADDISSDEEDKKEGEGEKEEGDEDKPQVGFYPFIHRPQVGFYPLTL